MTTGDAEGPALALRIGLHTGDVVQSEADFFGTVVNKAARITAAAEAGEVLVSEATRVMAGEAEDLALVPRGAVALKGFEGAHAVHRLDWQV